MRGRRDIDRRKRLAERVLRSVEQSSPDALELLAAGLRRTGESWAELGSVFSGYARARADGEATSQLAVLQLARWIRRVEASDGSVFARLTDDDADTGAPWAALRAVLLEQRAHAKGSAA